MVWLAHSSIGYSRIQNSLWLTLSLKQTAKDQVWNSTLSNDTKDKQPTTYCQDDDDYDDNQNKCQLLEVFMVRGRIKFYASVSYIPDTKVKSFWHKTAK